jgi:hypothetical protein
MKRIALVGGLGAALVAGIIAALALVSGPAAAGIGPAGFAQVAQRAIIAENNAVYGSGNSPWRVRCTEKPTYITVKLGDVVTCKITIRP